MTTNIVAGKVVVVTGAGGGIGRDIALAHGARGREASWSTTSAPRSPAKAQTPARRSRWSTRSSALGGEAVANTDSVAEPAAAQRIVAHARSTAFGRIDVRRQQRRHPARPLLPQDERRRMGRGDQGAPLRQLLRQPRRGRPFQGAGQRRLRAHDLDLGPDRQLRPGQLQRRQARHRGAVEVDRARHAEVQRALQLHRAVRLEPHDRLDPDRHARAGRRASRSSSR